MSGFTLTEMMVVIAIIAIALAIAIPTYSVWRERHALDTAADALMAHIKQARLIAIVENRSVKMTFTHTSYTLDPDSRNLTVELSSYSPKLRLGRTTSALAPVTLTFTSGGTASNWSCKLYGSGGDVRIIRVNRIGRVYFD